MDTKSMLSKTRALWDLQVYANFQDVPRVSIPLIPLQWELFPFSKTDYWKFIPTTDSDDRTSCLYRISPKGIFTAHIHAKSSETITLLTPNGRLKIVDEDGTRYLEYGESYTIPKGMMHAVENMCDFMLEIRVDWCPSMKGWEANSTEKEDTE